MEQSDQGLLGLSFHINVLRHMSVREGRAK